MDAFDFDNVKVEKANAILRYRRLRHIAKFFRLLELCLALLFLSWTFARLPIAVKITGEYFRLLISIVVSPLFIFVLSNLIVVTLLANSGQFSTVSNAGPNLIEDFVNNGENRINSGPDNSPPVPEPEEIVYQDKQIVYEVNTDTNPKEDRSEVALIAGTISDRKYYRRSQSENLKVVCPEKLSGQLRRSETEKCRKVASSDETTAETVELVDKLSNEEFQRTVEDFIAKQVRFHQVEKLAIVAPS